MVDNLSVGLLAKKLSGKILLRSEIPLSTSQANSLIKKNLLKLIPAITSTLFFTQCNRCGNKNKQYFGKIPCQICGKTHSYCRKCIIMGRVLLCQKLYLWNGPFPKWPRQENPCTWRGELTEAQNIAANRIKRAILQRENELMTWAVTGAGKTEMLFLGIAAALEQGMRVCLATPRADVVRELFPRISMAFSNTIIQAIYGGSKEKNADAQLMIATTHQLLRFHQAFDVIILDEMDAFPYTSDNTLPYVTKRALKQSGTMIYLTATPRIKEQIKVSQNKLPHVFVPIRFHQQRLPVPKQIPSFSLMKDLQTQKLPKALTHWLKTRKNPQRQLLLFCPTIMQLESLPLFLPKILKSHGIISDEAEFSIVHAADSMREEKINLFRNGRLKVLATTTILERGVTFPSVDVIVMDAGHIIFDEAALVQIAGRAGRSASDPTGEVIFLHRGKTDAIIQAIHLIKKMNKKAGF